MQRVNVGTVGHIDYGRKVDLTGRGMEGYMPNLKDMPSNTPYVRSSIPKAVLDVLIDQQTERQWTEVMQRVSFTLPQDLFGERYNRIIESEKTDLVWRLADNITSLDDLTIYETGGLYQQIANPNLGVEKIYQGDKLIVSIVGDLIQFSHKSPVAAQYLQRRTAIRATIGLNPWDENLTPEQQRLIMKRVEFDTVYFANIARRTENGDAAQPTGSVSPT